MAHVAESAVCVLVILGCLAVFAWDAASARRRRRNAPIPYRLVHGHNRATCQWCQDDDASEPHEAWGQR